MTEPSVGAYELLYIENEEKWLTLCAGEAACLLLRVKSLPSLFSRDTGTDGSCIKRRLFKLLNDSYFKIITS